MWDGLLRSSALLALIAAGCSQPAPVEVDGDRIRALVADVARGSGEAERDLVALAARSPEAKSLAFREADRALRTARLRALEGRAQEEDLLKLGRGLSQEEQERLRLALIQRAEAEARAACLEPLWEKLR